MSVHAQQDATVIRLDPSVSRAASGKGSGEADPPRVLKQRFVLEEKLGSGGMGSVYRAKDLRKVEARDRQPYLAIKVLNNDFRAHPEAFIALQREAAKSQSVSHPNIVSIFDFDKDGDVPFITMELLEGQELTDLLRAYPHGLPDSMAWPVIRGICWGLEHAHGSGIVHADFKPGNVFVSSQNTAKILDFGIARAVQINQQQGDDTMFDPARLAALTPAYASREMLNGDNPQPRDDIYSLGVVIYLILTGHHPFGRLAADKAAQESLRPEKPKRLTRRQWRALERCLRFNRHERPPSVSVLAEMLLERSPWRARLTLAMSILAAGALWVNYLIEDTQLSEVKDEVRQSTLLDSRVARISELIQQPKLDTVWEERVAEELEALRSLDASGAATAEMGQRLRDVYAARIDQTPRLGAALALYERALRFGALPATHARLHDRLVDTIVGILDAAALETAWFDDLDANLQRLEATFPQSRQSAALKWEVLDVLERQVQESVGSGQYPLAAKALSSLESLAFDAALVERNQALVADAEASYAAAARRRVAREQQAGFDTELSAVLAASCLRLDVDAIVAVQAGWRDREVALADDGRERIRERLGSCLAQLAEIDPQRAMDLQRRAQSAFQQLALPVIPTLDPCAAAYLVGNGAQGGRQGYCVDELTDGGLGPRLVVVPRPDGSGRFAIAKHEVTWGEFDAFCRQRGDCDVRGDADLPVTGVPLASARAYASWLSERAGFAYRLPTVDEWRQAATGGPDPNRNCRVQVDGVERGLKPVPAMTGQASAYGLVNALGNVQEWASGPDGLVAMGGAFVDPIQSCVVETARKHGGQADEYTGFRLLREIS